MTAGIKIRIAVAVIAVSALIGGFFVSGVFSSPKKSKPGNGAPKAAVPPIVSPPPVIPSPPPYVAPPPPTPPVTANRAGLIKALTSTTANAGDVIAALGPDPIGELTKILAGDAPTSVKLNAMWAAKAIAARGRVTDLIDQPYPERVEIRDNALKGALEKLSGSRDEDDRVRIAALAMLPGDSIATFQSIIGAESRGPVLMAALERLTRSPLEEKDLDALHARAEKLLLDSDDPEVRGAAARTFMVGKSESSGPALLHALGSERDPSRRRSYLEIIAGAQDGGLSAYAMRSGMRLESEEGEGTVVTRITSKAFEHAPDAFFEEAKGRFAARPPGERIMMLQSFERAAARQPALTPSIKAFLTSQRGGDDDAAIAEALGRLQ